LWFSGSAVVILRYFSADVARAWEGDALTGYEAWHPCTPLEPGDACHGWYGPRQSEQPRGGAEQALPGEGKALARWWGLEAHSYMTALQALRYQKRLSPSRNSLPCRGYCCLRGGLRAAQLSPSPSALPAMRCQRPVPARRSGTRPLTLPSGPCPDSWFNST